MTDVLSAQWLTGQKQKFIDEVLMAVKTDSSHADFINNSVEAKLN